MTVELNHRIDGSGPHVLLMHAVGMDLTFLDAVTALLAKDFTVLRVDLRGHGKTAYAPAASLADYADDVHALLVKLNFAPCAVGGFAMGGMVTQALAVKYPQDVRALMIACCAHAQTPESKKALAARAEGTAQGGMAGIVETTMERWFTDPFIARGADAAVRERLRTDDVRGWVDAYTAMGNIDTAERLKAITVPTLCLAGEVDRSTPPPIVKAIADTIPGARYVMMPKAPHMLFLERPEETASIVGGFLKEVL